MSAGADCLGLVWFVLVWKASNHQVQDGRRRQPEVLGAFPLLSPRLHNLVAKMRTSDDRGPDVDHTARRPRHSVKQDRTHKVLADTPRRGRIRPRKHHRPAPDLPAHPFPSQATTIPHTPDNILGGKASPAQRMPKAKGDRRWGKRTDKRTKRKQCNLLTAHIETR